VAEVRALPGVKNAAFSSTLPFQSIGNTTGYEVEGRPPAANQDTLYRVFTGDYLKTMGAELLEGRMPDDRDGVGSPPIAVVNETFARLYWPGESAIGHRVRFGRTSPWRAVVGVVKDVRERGYQLEMKVGAYVPFTQVLTVWQPEMLVVRTSGDPRALASAVRRVVLAADPEQPVSAVRSMDEIVDSSVADRSQQTVLLGHSPRSPCFSPASGCTACCRMRSPSA